MTDTRNNNQASADKPSLPPSGEETVDRLRMRAAEALESVRLDLADEIPVGIDGQELQFAELPRVPDEAPGSVCAIRVLDQPCRQRIPRDQAGFQAREWEAAGIPFGRIAVNVSGMQIQRSDFARTLESILHDTATLSARGRLPPCARRSLQPAGCAGGDRSALVLTRRRRTSRAVHESVTMGLSWRTPRRPCSYRGRVDCAAHYPTALVYPPTRISDGAGLTSKAGGPIAAVDRPGAGEEPDHPVPGATEPRRGVTTR